MSASAVADLKADSRLPANLSPTAYDARAGYSERYTLARDIPS
jgi:hypothetical protein